MTRLLAPLAAIGVMTLVALPAPASANERAVTGVGNIEQTDVSAARRVYRRYYGRPYVGPRYRAYYGRPYYEPYYSYGPAYYAPAPFPFFPFFGW